MLVALPAAVLFASGSAQLSDDGKKALMEVGVILKKLPERDFMVAGHTDNTPLRSAEYRNNWELSTARAVNVTEFLVYVGMKPQSLVAAGYGEFDPVASNKTKEGKAKNRRIEIILLPNLDELPAIPEDMGGPAASGP
jgi:chemotaxis protein MotB